jgi:hypothetical protein
MTEEIIIDGVNVAGCEFCNPNPLYKIEYACYCRGYIQDDGLHVHLSCEHNPNCYYKQLKRLEQENRELKEFCVELERQKQKQHMQWFERCTEINVEASQYRSALEEIRENLVKLKTNDEDDFTYEYSKIEDKINEVLE